MSGSPRGESPETYKNDIHDAAGRDSADTDIDLEEAQLLLRDEFDFEDNEPPRRSPKDRPSGCLGFLNGPQPSRPQKIEPFFRSIQEGPSKLLNKLLPRSEHQNLFLNIILVVWLLLFIGLLTTELPTVDGSGKHVINLDCTDSLWKRKNGCGIHGVDCHPFSDTSFAFRCPPKCADVQLLNPHAVGAYDANYRPLVVGSETYRGDSFICASAIHAGIVTDFSGGCGRINLIGKHSGFKSIRSHDIESIPFDSEFPLSFNFTSANEDGFKCSSEPRSTLLFVSLLATIALSLFSSKSKIFFPIFVIIFAHVSFVSDPPQASYRNITVLPDHLSQFAKRMLPAFFVAVIIWMTVIKRTLSGLDAPIEKSILWLGGFWIGALSNYTFDWIPISRLTTHDLEQQPGAKVALAIIIGVIAVIAVGQIYYFWLEGRLLKYLGLYGLYLIGILFCLAMPGLNLRIHHYIIGLLLLPGTSMQTRPSLLYQGILLGLFVNGVARWDFDSILQTTAALREDGRFNSVVPAMLQPVIEPNVMNGLVASFSWKFLPDGIDGISVLVNDVERYRKFIDEKPDGDVFRWGRSPDDTMNYYIRFAFIQNGRTLDYSKAGTFLSNGTWAA
ncbi:LCCL domain-containing protein [Stagonosporopsis vannaccii]|nr:LCCL domain-containing protein [Stagonosporopsis vannaccii]